jgi:predicted amidohydrolase YtcJ
LHAPEAGRRIGGYKIFSDGTFGSCTACMSEPFSDRPDRKGYMTLSEEEIYARMERAHAAGLQICVHAIGDAANERCVALFERLLEAHPLQDHRHRLEHASLLAPSLIERIARRGIAVSTQPLFIASERGWLHKRLGVKRSRYVYPLRALLDAGVLVGGASDAPVESTHVLRAIECCVTRDGFETQQSITAEEALRMFTIDAARVQREEAEKGSIAAGKRADLALLDASPLEVPADRIGAIRAVRTIVAGRTVYDAAEEGR